MLKQLMAETEFPQDVSIALRKHLKRPKASSCSDPELFKILKRYDPHSLAVFLDSLIEGEEFIFQERVFKRGSKRRTRIECSELKSGRIYLISGHAEVEKFVNS